MFLIRPGLFFSGYALLRRDFLLRDWAFEEVFHIFESNKILPIRVKGPLLLYVVPLQIQIYK